MVGGWYKSKISVVTFDNEQNFFLTWLDLECDNLGEKEC